MTPELLPSTMGGNGDDRIMDHPHSQGRRARSRISGSAVRITILTLLVLSVIAGGASAAVHASLGDTIHLSGTAYSTYVYLFVTGPNLPINGAALDDPSSGGSFTRIAVDDDDQWTYNWDTHRIPLDAGSYSIWVVDAPVGRTELADHDYSRISVIFSKPSISASHGGTSGETVSPGTLAIVAIPEHSSVMIGGQYRGMTPLSVEGLAPATYTVTLSHFGYSSVTRQVTVEAGTTTFINASLIPLPGAIRVETMPAGARILLDGTVTGVSPLLLENVSAGNHTIRAELSGYVPVENSVTVTGNITANVSLALQREGVSPSVTRAGDPAAAMIVILTAGLIVMAVHKRRQDEKPGAVTTDHNRRV